jgi:hypothetical protein
MAGDKYMINNWFGVHDGLASAGRVPSISRIRERISAMEIVMLLAFGVASAAAVGFIRTGFRFPGNAILFAMLPMVLGLALAPRRHAGYIMGAGALGTATLFGMTGLAHYGSGASVSLCLIGPVMDLALAKAKRGIRLYLGLVLAGIATNLLALFSRGAAKLVGLDLSGTRPFGTWYIQASMTYALCGAVAGLIAAFCFFQFRRQGAESQQDAH